MSTKAADIKMVKAVSQKSGETATPALPEGVGTLALWLILVLAMAGFMHLGFNDVGNTRGLKVYGVTIPDFGSLNIPGLDKVLAQGNQTKPEPKPPVVAPAPAPQVTPSAQVAQAVAFALAQKGKPYIWGAVGPDAYDCSGLIYTAYKSAGVRIERVSQLQWTSQRKIPLGQEQPGDEVYTYFGPYDGHIGLYPDHVGLYIGNGMVIEAPHTNAFVDLMPLAEFIGGTAGAHGVAISRPIG